MWGIFRLPRHPGPHEPLQAPSFHYLFDWIYNLTVPLSDGAEAGRGPASADGFLSHGEPTKQQLL
jgi:hypothetical protein